MDKPYDDSNWRNEYIDLQIKLMEFLLHNISARKIKWSLVAAKTECTGQEERWIGKVQDVETCARSCKGVSSMFIYGTNDFGEFGCIDGQCKCLCLNSDDEKACESVNEYQYWFYNFKNAGKL